MLEEAAGTRMYETKKEAALRTLEKKQVKVDEIDKVRQTEPPKHDTACNKQTAEIHPRSPGINARSPTAHLGQPRRLGRRC